MNEKDIESVKKGDKLVFQTPDRKGNPKDHFYFTVKDKRQDEMGVFIVQSEETGVWFEMSDCRKWYQSDRFVVKRLEVGTI